MRLGRILNLLLAVEGSIVEGSDSREIGFCVDAISIAGGENRPRRGP